VSETKTQRSLAKGLVAGLIAGLAATAAKTAAEMLFPPRVHGEQNPAEVLAEKVAGHELDRETKTNAGKAIHWGFGAAAGAAYGALAEFYPAATAKKGATFGLTLMALTEETALPAMEVAEPAEDQTPRERTSEATSHLVYGLVAERVRSFVRGLLG
jgi:putative membrane protein